jgi:hypothetical protein
MDVLPKKHSVRLIDDNNDLRRSFYEVFVKSNGFRHDPAGGDEEAISVVSKAKARVHSDGKARIRANGERPRGGTHDSTREPVSLQGMSPKALKQRITRHNEKPPTK